MTLAYVELEDIGRVVMTYAMPMAISMTIMSCYVGKRWDLYPKSPSFWAEAGVFLCSWVYISHIGRTNVGNYLCYNLIDGRLGS